MGIKKNIIKKSIYKDSVFLMQISAELEKKENLTAVSLMMGTPANKNILKESGLLLAEGDAASENDLIIAIDADSSGALDAAVDFIENRFGSGTDYGEVSSFTPSTITSALKNDPEINFALISVAGHYAAREADIALEHGMNVMLFSDNVSVEDELALKSKASKKGLLLMGPDCGTAIINGVPLGFANCVKKGDIGIVAASGTGLQEVTVTIAKQGCGITQAFGTGGRDLSMEIGGVTMLDAFRYLADDAGTKVIVIISKPPHRSVAEKMITAARSSSKPVVICFLGAGSYESEKNLFFTDTLEKAGLTAAALSLSPGKYTGIVRETDADENLISEALSRIPGTGKYIRGLYAGGTLCDESLDILKKSGLKPYTNAGGKDDLKLPDLNTSIEHSLIDMGEDEFTRGRPHPMIDLTLRNKRMEKEAADTSTALILFDVVLGYGANDDPVGAMEDTLNKIKDTALVCSITGTDLDPQNAAAQAEKLRKCGVFILPTNAAAARYAADIMRRIGG